METQVIEINGVKMEVDLRHAKRIDTIRVGTKVKLLCKSDYSEPSVKSGVVVGFEPFEDLPTIIVCYLDVTYNESKIEFAYINASPKSKQKYELVVSVDDDMPFQKQDVLSKMQREEDALHEKVAELRRKREYFLLHFSTYFEDTSKVV